MESLKPKLTRRNLLHKAAGMIFFELVKLKELHDNILSLLIGGLNHNLSVGKPKNNSVPRKKNTKWVILTRRRMAKDGDD